MAMPDTELDELIAEILAEPVATKPLPTPVKVEVGQRVKYLSLGYSTNNERIGTVVELPGPSLKYDGRDAERIEVLLDATDEDPALTIFTDNNAYGGVYPL